MKIKITVLILASLTFLPALAHADSNSSDILKQGLLGAGSGSIGALASGAKGKDVWKGALAGSAVNVVGGALLDSASGEKVQQVQQVQSMPGQDAFTQGYQQGYNNGYQAGYVNGMRDGVRDATSGRYHEVPGPYYGPQQPQQR